MRLFPVFSAFVVLVAVGATSTSCGRVLPAPEAPARVLPTFSDLPDSIAINEGRAIIDSAGEPARVYSVQSVSHGVTGGHAPANGIFGSQPEHGVSSTGMTPLCLTPCAIDVLRGYQYLFFESLQDPNRHSYADLNIQDQRTTVLQHRMGKDAAYSGAWIGGAMSTAMGIGLTLMGGALLASSFGMDNINKPSSSSGMESANSGSSLRSIGLGVLGAGVTLDVVGLWFMLRDQPTRQPGSTTMWVVP